MAPSPPDAGPPSAGSPLAGLRGTGLRSARLRDTRLRDTRLHDGADIGLGVVLAVGVATRTMVDGAPWLLATGAAVACLTLVARRRWPVPVLVLLVVAAGGAALIGHPLALLFVAAEIGLYTVAVRTTRPRTLIAAALTGAVLFFSARTVTEGPPTEPASLIVVVWTALAAAVGDAVRNHRAYVTALAERAHRAEETRDAVARARVTEERVRIARELHDVVAHQLAVISVHAGLAARSVRTSPDQAEGSLTHVQEAARTALDELGAVLRVLRAGPSGDDLSRDTGGEPPAPGMADVDSLLRSFTEIGLAVRTSVTGRPVALDAACDLTAYRVLQEALTNAHKHGADGTTLVRIDHRLDGLDLVVSNPVTWPTTTPLPEVPGTGNGLLGMRERVESVGGRLTTQSDRDGTFRLEAHIPTTPTAGPAPTPAPAPAPAPRHGTTTGPAAVEPSPDLPRSRPGGTAPDGAAGSTGVAR